MNLFRTEWLDSTRLHWALRGKSLLQNNTSSTILSVKRLPMFQSLTLHTHTHTLVTTCSCYNNPTWSIWNFKKSEVTARGSRRLGSDFEAVWLRLCTRPLQFKQNVFYKYFNILIIIKMVNLSFRFETFVHAILIFTDISF